MNTKLRYTLALALGIGVAVFTWYHIALSHPIFIQRGFSGLVAPAAASILGGFVVASISPNHKLKMSVFVGFVVALPVLLFLFRNGFSHFGRNPFFWYWPIYVMPFFYLGGFLGRGIWCNA